MERRMTISRWWRGCYWWWSLWYLVLVIMFYRKVTAWHWAEVTVIGIIFTGIVIWVPGEAILRKASKSDITLLWWQFNVWLENKNILTFKIIMFMSKKFFDKCQFLLDKIANINLEHYVHYFLLNNSIHK